MRQYLDLLRDIKDNGVKKQDRTGVGTQSLFGRQIRFDLSKGFPAVTTKKLAMRAVIYELLWFLRGDTNIKFLVDNDVKIWNEWAYQVYLEENGLDKKYERYCDGWKLEMDKFIDKMKNDDKFAKRWGELDQFMGSSGSDGKPLTVLKLTK